MARKAVTSKPAYELSRPATMTRFPQGYEIYVPLLPVPAARPKVGRWGAYYPKTYTRFKALADDVLRPLAIGAKLYSDYVFISIEHVTIKPKSGKLGRPNGDWDNFVKGSQDAVTKAQCVWVDDAQVAFGMSNKRYAVGSEESYFRLRVSESLGLLWLAEPILRGEDIWDRYEHITLEEADGHPVRQGGAAMPE